MSQTQVQLVGNVVTGAVIAGIVTANEIKIGDSVGMNTSGIVTATGFVGDLTGNATGLSGTPNLNVGIVTATTISVSGNISVGGTLTYEDVTNVDSIGLITARSGIQVLAGGIDAVGIVTANGYEGNFILDSYLFN